MKVKFSMSCDCIGSEKEEVMEFTDDITEDGIEEELDTWFWDNFRGWYKYEIIEE